MKSVFTILFTVFLLFTTKAQVWFEVGGKAMYGMKGFYNNNVFNDRDHQYQFGSGLAYGGVLCINIADRNGFNIEALSASNEQKFEYNNTNVNDLEWKTLDLYLLYRAYSNSAFIEIGPKYSKVNSITQSYGSTNYNLNGEYQDQYFSAVFGFGGLITGSEFLTLKSGVRFEYALGDFVSAKGKDTGYPTVYLQTPYDTYAATHPFSASVYLSLNFAIGAVAKAECGKRRFIFGSGY